MLYLAALDGFVHGISRLDGFEHRELVPNHGIQGHLIPDRLGHGIEAEGNFKVFAGAGGGIGRFPGELEAADFRPPLSWCQVASTDTVPELSGINKPEVQAKDFLTL